ncbi:MAG: endonuclease/exonuclease/phosphatase family protein [Gaiellales bacterium]
MPRLGSPRGPRWGALLAAACVLAVAGAAPAGAAGHASARAVTVRVMTFNIGGDEWGGDLTPPWSRATRPKLQDVASAILAAHADVVGLQEPYGRMILLAHMLGPGWYTAPRLHTLARYPILEPPGAHGVWGWLELSPGRMMAIFNTHLPSGLYGPGRVRHGIPRAQVVAGERELRVPWMRPILAAAGPLIAAGVPTVLTGDFNSPSWRDWTAAAARARGLPYSVRWPVSLQVEHAGFRDSYRQVHPNALASPGITWTTGFPGPPPGPRQIDDRIDFIWDAGAIRAVGSQVIGEPGSPYTDVAVTPWVSDHRAVVSTLAVRPVSPPPLIALPTARITRGDGVAVRFHTTGGSGFRVAVVHHRAPLSAALVTKGTGSAADGELTIPTGHLAAGAYDAVLVSPAGRELGRLEFAVVPPGARTTVSVPRSIVAGSPIPVRVANAPGNRYDWLAVIRGTRSPLVAPYLRWRYTGAAVDGSMAIDPTANGNRPLPPGHYAIWFCLDDGYFCTAHARFVIHGG